MWHNIFNFPTQCLYKISLPQHSVLCYIWVIIKKQNTIKMYTKDQIQSCSSVKNVSYLQKGDWDPMEDLTGGRRQFLTSILSAAPTHMPPQLLHTSRTVWGDTDSYNGRRNQWKIMLPLILQWKCSMSSVLLTRTLMQTKNVKNMYVLQTSENKKQKMKESKILTFWLHVLYALFDWYRVF